MKYSKPHLPYEDQLDLLIRRGLACSDRAGTLYWLKRIGYYRLITQGAPLAKPRRGRVEPSPAA
jgi:abortive infection bacteriophage resistance protein